MFKPHVLKASTLRLILVVSMFLIVGLAVAMFYFANQYLSKVATDVGSVLVEAESSQDSLQSLQATERRLSNESAAVERASNIVADSQNYQYQNKILTDLDNYAAQSGVDIRSINLSSGGSASDDTPVASRAPAGLNTTSASVTLGNPVDYNNLLHFIRSIEQNLTKMQIATISLSRADSSNQVTSDSLTIEVYIR